ncbi:Telomerase-binding protein EST1A [Atta colombica]|uniref:Telomerase-binding protein EST1A n=1 Tax=Atta colombica TaxID=520822 RepID=A0A151I0D5_9HYME|nr:Telomerase-binding protein EST1A [Atta colombica]
METFQEAGVQMLKEFRALLQHSPLPLPGTRLLQLLALNMFAIETTQLKAFFQFKLLSEKRLTLAGDRDLFSSGPNSLDAHADIRMDDRSSVAVQKLISCYVFILLARIAALDCIGQTCPI